MQWLAEVCVRRPVFTWVLMLAFVVIGYASMSGLGVDRFPKIDFPFVLITTVLPGASPEQVETEVSDKIEEAVNSVAGLEELQSKSYEGLSVVMARFDMETDSAVDAQEVRDRVNQVLTLLPETAEQPRVLRQDPDAAPIMLIALSSNRSPRENTEYALRKIRRRIESLTGVGGVVVLGGRERTIEVVVDPNRLQNYGLTAADVQTALATQNIDIPGGEVKEGVRSLNLRVQGRLQRVEDFEDISVALRMGRSVKLGDVATVHDTESDAESAASVNGKGVVILQVRKQSGSNTVAVIDSLRERVGEIKADLPPGFQLNIVRDESEFIRNAIDAVEEHLVLGSLLAAIVVLLFLWNGRTTLIAALAIPTSIISTFAFIKAMNLTLNTITLLGLTLAVGIVIDDAIVVLENIFKFIEEKGYEPKKAAIAATKEIGLAVLATTLSLVAVFMPVAFMGGIVGRFMNSFGFVMSFSIVVSLIVSFTLTPMLSSRWIKPSGKKKHDELDHEATHADVHHDDLEIPDPEPEARPYEIAAFRAWRSGERKAPAGFDSEHGGHGGVYAMIEGAYLKLLATVMARRWIIGLAIMFVMGSLPTLVKNVQKNFLPLDDESRFEINMRAPEGTSLEETGLLSERIAREIHLIKGVKDTVITTGSPAGDPSGRGVNQSSIFISLVPTDQRKESQQELMAVVRDQVLPKFEKYKLRTLVAPVNVFGGSAEDSAPIQYILSGPDLVKLGEYSEHMVAEVKKIKGVVDADSTLIVGMPEYVVHIDRDRAADLGVSVINVANTLRMLVGGLQVTTYSEGGEQYDVRMRGSGDFRMSPERIAQVTIPAGPPGSGRSVRLSDVVKINEASGPSVVSHYGRQRSFKIYANVLPGTSEQGVIDQFTAIKENLHMEPGFKGELTGRAKELAKAFKSLMFAFALSLIFMYLVLAAQFESWIHPITILISLPLTIPFAVFSVIMLNQSLNIFSMLGVLVLFGIVKKNSILQVDHMRDLRRRGLERVDAIMIGNRDRLRPILMTTVAFVAGMIPLVASSGAGAGTNRAMASVVIGGQTLALLLTLLATPVVFSWFDDLAHSRFTKLITRFFGAIISGIDGIFTAKKSAVGISDDNAPQEKLAE